MYLSNRKSKIISELLNNNDYITGQYLANITGVTARTVRGDIAELCKLGINIKSISGRGYYLAKDEKRDLSSLVNVNQEYIMPITPESRQKHILKQLILNPAGVKIDKISKQLYVSKSTLDRDFSSIKRRLQECSLQLVKKAGDILCIDGDELIIRKMYNDFIEKNVNVHSLDANIFNDELNSIFLKIKTIVYSALMQENINLTGEEYDAVVVMLTVTVFRNINGCCLDSFDGECIADFKLSNKIVNTVESEFRFKLNDSEQNCIEYSLWNLMEKRNEAGNNVVDIRAIEQSISKVSKTYNYEFEDDFSEKLYSILINSQVKTSEYSLVDIEMEYPLAFEMAVSLVNDVFNKAEVNKSDNALIKIILLIAYSMEKHMLEKEREKRQVIIICQSDEFTNNLIETKLKRYFPGFNILGFFPLYRIEEALCLCPELIISTVMVENSDIPVIIINPLFKDYDAVKINTVLRSIEYGENSSYQLLNLFREDLFVKDIEAFDKYDAIRKLFDAMRMNGYAQENFFQLAVERENISTTAIGNMVAVPHAINDGIGENIAAVGILNKPIKWNDDNVQLVFLININNTGNRNVKQIFRSLFDVISSNQRVERLIKSKNYYEFLKTMNQ